MLGDLIDVTLGDRRTQVLIVAKHDHLHQVVIFKLIVAIGVKVLHDVVSVGLCGLFNAIVPAT